MSAQKTIVDNHESVALRRRGRAFAPQTTVRYLDSSSSAGALEELASLFMLESILSLES